MGAATIYNALLSTGLKPHQAAGFLGNFMEESSLNPRAWNKGEAAAGLAQWRGPRLQALRDYAARNNADVNDLGIQAKFAVHEMSTNPAYRNSWALMQKAQNADDAARAVTTWEKPKGYNPRTNDPSGVPSMGDRIGHARSFLAKLGGGNVGIEGSNNSASPTWAGSSVPFIAPNNPSMPTVAEGGMGPDIPNPNAATPPANPYAAPTKFGDGGLIGMAMSDGGITADKLKGFMGGSDMKAGMAGLGMLAQGLAGGGEKAPQIQAAPIDAHTPQVDPGMMEMLLKRKKGLV